MDRDSFIIAVFLVVCEQYGVIRQQCRLRRGGFSPALTDEEVITVEICGEYFKLECDKDIFAYFHAHYRHLFSKTDREVFICPAICEFMAGQSCCSKTPDNDQRGNK